MAKKTTNIKTAVKKKKTSVKKLSSQKNKKNTTTPSSTHKKEKEKETVIKTPSSSSPLKIKNSENNPTPPTQEVEPTLSQKSTYHNDTINANINDTQNKTSDTVEPKRKRRSKKIKTWEEKAKKLPTFQISNYPKLPIKNILITQVKPTDLQNPYQFLIDKYKVNITFRPFIKVEGLSAQEFRNQRVDILEYKGIILTSRLAIDHFFRITNEMRITLPDDVKYFCLNEQIAYYMQKYMEFRKRRIFWGQGTLDDLKQVLKKNIDGKFLLPASDTIKEKIINILDSLGAKYQTADVYKTVPENIKDINPSKFDLITFFTPIAAESFKKNFPEFRQNKTRFAAYSIITANKLQELGYRVDIFAPTLEFPSMVNAIAHYLLNVD